MVSAGQRLLPSYGGGGLTPRRKAAGEAIHSQDWTFRSVVTFKFSS